MVHRVPLVTQQAKFLQDNTGFKVRGFCGGDNVDFWKREQWLQEIGKHQVLVMVHDVFLLALDHGYMRMKDVNLLIVDECHHSFGNSSYNRIFNGHYHPLKEIYPLETPHVLGLTASIVTSKMNSLAKFLEEKSKLEKVLDSEVITTSDMANLLKFATQPDESMIVYDPLQIYPDLGQAINQGVEALESLKRSEIQKIELSPDLIGIPGKKAIEDAKSMSKKFDRILKQTEKCLTELGIFHGKKVLECAYENVIEELMVKAESGFKQNLAKAVSETLKRLKELGNSNCMH